MAWKDWPTWLKGGVILMVLDVFVLILAFMGTPFDAKAYGLIATQIPVSYLYLNFSGIQNNSDLIVMSLLGLCNWFIIGALIGFVIGKFAPKEYPREGKNSERVNLKTAKELTTKR
jgi:uncharacterized phage infection (PIP) family protein YhgE